MDEGLLELFDEISPIESYNGNLRLHFPSNHPDSKQWGLKFWYEEPKYSRELCLERDMSYAVPLYAKVALINREAGDEVSISDIFMGEFPLMTDKGTFIINGTERVVVSQLIRSPGVYFETEEERSTGRKLASSKLIPDRGAWMEFETRKSDALVLKFNRKRTVPVTVLLRAMAAVKDELDRLGLDTPIKTGSDEEILALFADVDNGEGHTFISKTIEGETDFQKTKDGNIAQAALLEFYKKMRPGDPPTLDNAREYLEQQLFDQRRYDLERVGRYKLNKRLGLQGEIPQAVRTITKRDIINLIRTMIQINNNQQ
ncbi:MAG: DNA-directed RNA polymerase subunit beta, partial [Anaerolineae bacterium]|nr:DNA-directed RNA polymerase subunit beta [Anaerolineae bacterium]